MTETDTSTESKFNVTSASLTVTSLHPYYVYTISVAAETVVGIGPYSDGVNVTTDEDGRFIGGYRLVTHHNISQFQQQPQDIFQQLSTLHLKLTCLGRLLPPASKMESSPTMS